MKIELIKVGNGNKNYPGNFTKKEKEIILKESKSKILNLFSGKSTIGNERIDYSCKEATNNINVFDYLENLSNNINFKTVIIDSPYNQKFADKYQKLGNTPKQFIIFANAKQTTILFNLIIEKVNPKIIIIKSWNYYVPKGYNNLHNKCFVCYAGGYRKSTFLMICKKIRSN